MTISPALRASLSSIALIAGLHGGLAHAADPAPAAVADAAPVADAGEAIIVTAKQTRSATAVTGLEIQKILPGISPLKAIETLPGVLYISSDPWGNNEQNAQIFIHGFNYQQLGYTLDGLPLGDQNYGNYNGLSPQRAVISEVVSRVVVSTGAGDLGTASTSNLGGAIDSFTADPKKSLGLEVAETVGSYGTSRTYGRIDSGAFGPGGDNAAYVAVARQRARAWDFNGIQGGWQVNGKFVHDDSVGKLTAYFDYSQKTEPNEDATSFRIPATTAAQAYTPYIRPYGYPNYAGYTSYLSAYGNTPAAQGSNYNNYYSDAQRTDYLGYLKYDAHLTDKLNWSTQGYFHHNDGVGVVAGPLGQSITVIQAYLDPNYKTDTHFTGNNNGTGNPALGAQLVAATGGSGQVIRTTEYRIDREGVVSALHLDAGAHQIEFGGWFEHNSATQWRRWYGADATNPSSFTPYIRPSNPLFTQYQGEARVQDLQLHLQDNWRATERLAIEAGFKTSAQWANGYYPVQPKLGSLSGLGAGGLPQGRINTTKWFLPAFGAKYDLTSHEQLYVNVQKNLRQYMTYLGGASLSPWFTGSQSAFNTFASQGKPEESWTYEVGLRTKRTFDSPISALEAQVNYYHVNFSNRQLAINTNPGGIAGSGITGGTAILVNVGSVHTDGVDAGFTIHAGPHASLYNAVSYNRSTYQSDYTATASGIGAATGTCIGGYAIPAAGQPNAGTVPTCGKVIPGTPMWMNKTVASLNFGPVEFQAIGDYVGKRYATYVNDTSVPSYFLASARLAVHLPAEMVHLAKADISLNVTNITKETGASTISIGSATNSYSVYPIAPRQWFLTFGAGF
ncbi:TonB-dependent receptor [Novosphingobium sp.]|uniref:TonB-dependent receptor n=1 Tax=Novosphingobium sp. TaxID=1874826 RepID=UPI003D12C9C0